MWRTSNILYIFLKLWALNYTYQTQWTEHESSNCHMTLTSSFGCRMREHVEFVMHFSCFYHTHWYPGQVAIFLVFTIPTDIQDKQLFSLFLPYPLISWTSSYFSCFYHTHWYPGQVAIFLVFTIPADIQDKQLFSLLLPYPLISRTSSYFSCFYHTRWYPGQIAIFLVFTIPAEIQDK